MSYKIKTIINGEKHTLNKVGPPIYQKHEIRSYVASEFRDVMKSMKDIEEIEYFKGNKSLFKYNYDKNYDPLNEILSMK